MKMNSDERYVLVIDDQQHIHDTFDRIFASTHKATDDALSDFEAMFLDQDSEQEDTPNTDGPCYRLTHANCGEDGIHCVEESIENGTPFSVAFVDMRMPNGIDGLATTQRIWQLDPNLQVVICTAYSDHTWEHVLEKLGYNDRLLLLKKPFERDEARQLALALSEKRRLAERQERQVDELMSEVDRRRRAEDEMRQMAHQDALTRLPNRQFLLKHLDQLLGNPSPSATHDALLFLDLDNFKIINDSLGHDAGDDLLNQVAKRLQECVRQRDEQPDSKSNDEIVRLGGDEFVVLLEGLANKEDAILVARRIVQRIAEPFQLGDRFVNVGTSVGLAFIDDAIQDAHDAMRNADTAMYRAKNSGKGQIAVFDKTMHEAVVARHDLENELRQALRDESFELHYQPIIGLKSGNVQGVEVLLRWRNSSGNYVPPIQFISIAEEIGLIAHLGEWVLENAMREFGEMLQSLPETADRNVYLGMNVSRRQLGDPFFSKRLLDIVEKTGFSANQVKIEMNEAGDPRHNDRSLETMLSLTENEVGIHVDDFGKGQSSLTSFQSYPIETVKIDRSFTASITSDHGHAVITQAIVQLAHHLNATIVCEGVESKQQLDLLRQWGCDSAQGYLFAPALDIEQLKELLKNPMQSEGIQLIRSSASPLLVDNGGSPGMSIQLT